MKKRFVMLALILSLAFAGCGSGAAGSVQAQVRKTDGEITEEKAEERNIQEEEWSAGTEKRTMTKAGSKGQGTEKTGMAEKEKEEETEPLEYTVNSFEEEKTMYATSPVNVRKGPSTSFERIGGLGRGQEVTATGQADTGWYEIEYDENIAYVSGKYLQEEKPAAPEAEPENQQQGAQAKQPAAEAKNVSGVILVGDSRFVQMQSYAGENSCTWIAESGKGYQWFYDNAVARIDACVGKGSKILINLGVNDPGNINHYLELVNAKAAEWAGKGAKVYYASVNPVWDNPYVTEEQVQYFNSQMQNGLSGDIQWIDSHSYLNSIGYKLVDGLHFNAETYQNLYAYYMSCL